VRVRPCFRERALLLEADEGREGEGAVLVIGDVHVGLEEALAKQGLRVPDQTPRLRARIEALLQEHGATRLIVLGDLKEAIGRPSDADVRKLRALFRGLPAELDLVPGNHDFDLDWLGVERVRLHDATGLRLGDVGLAHGHTWPSDEVMAARWVVTSHNHPMLGLRDELGKLHKEPCWVRGAFTEAARQHYPGMAEDARFIIMPAFNELLGGTAINGPRGPDQREHEGIGPLLKNKLVDLDNALVYTLDGVEMGAVGALRAFAQRA
jgi:putative SbcD/Mre11-related phosphoesterase